MNRILVSVAAGVVLCMTGLAQAADISLTQGKVISKRAGNVTLHDYVTDTGGAAQIVETDRLVIFDVPGNAPQNREFKALVEALGKPVEAVVISHAHDHHWLGADTLFPGVRIYSLNAASINGEEGMKALEGAKASMGEEMIPYTSVPRVEQLADGKHTIGGVEYLFTSLPDSGASIIALPAEKMAMVHHLGYVGVHVPMSPFAARLAQLEKLQNEGYAWIVAGHGTPSDSRDFIAHVAEYYAFVEKAVKEAGSPEKARAIIVAQYPDYGLVPLLDVFLPMLTGK